jgi:beta-1,4-mannosyl-glycoprotein beta-1,4-N-acetylglucosaminyltransferase
MYFDEDLLLELRLNTLNNFVDKFIIVEADITHTGKAKKLKFDINKFEKFKHKIDYHPLQNLKVDKNLKLKKNWSKHHLVDQSIRNSIANYINDASDDDWIIISDIDEIPNPNQFKFFDKKKKFGFFEQELFCYKFNLKNFSEPHWFGSRICVKKYLKSPQWLRNFKIKSNDSFFKNFFNSRHILKAGGWHFSSIKKPSEIITKLKSFAHTELVMDHMLDESFIKKKIDSQEDIFDRKITLKKIEINQKFPQYLLENPKKFKDFII